MKMITGFFGGLGSVLMAVVPVSILWYVLTGGSVFGMDVVANLSALITSLGEGCSTFNIICISTEFHGSNNLQRTGKWGIIRNG